MDIIILVAQQETKQAIVSLGLMVLAVGLSILAAKLLAKQPDTPVVDDKPTTLTSRGSFISWLIGRRRVGPVFAWAGGRYTIKEKASGGGKGFFSPDAPKTIIYYESGWHQLAMGPCDVLHGIYQGGQLIFQGPITRTSHPSGTTVDLGKEGAFKIYWGEDTQAVNATLAGQIGVASRWPNVCYIHWNAKRLGQSPIWQLIEYDLERYTSQSVLTDTEAVVDPDTELSSIEVDVYGNLDGVSGVGYFDLLNDYTPHFKVTGKVRLTNNAMSDTDLTISNTSTYQEVAWGSGGSFIQFRTVTRIYFVETLSGTDDAGELTTYQNTNVGGINGAHAIAEMLFAEFPLGLNLNQNDWDLDSMETLGTLLDTANEGIPCSMIGIDGEEARSLLGAALQDLGVLLTIHPSNGKLYFNAIREPTGSLQTLKDAQINDPLPQIETLYGPTSIDKYIFGFSDWEHAFKNVTIAIDEDGQASYYEHQRAKKIQLVLPVDIDTAAKVAERRSQEELAGGAVFSMTANHGARMLVVGEAVLIENMNDIYRVVSMKVDPEISKVKLQVMPDVFGAKLSTFENENGGGEYSYDPALQDAQFGYVEIPEYWLANNPMTIMVPRIRDSADIIGANIYISRDDSTYTFVQQDIAYAAGGILIDSVEATGEKSIAQGPTFTAQGPDIASVLDLSADDLNWRLGRQILIWGSEVCFVQQITAIGGDVYRLDGILRARWDTEMQEHNADEPLFIFEANNFELIQDLLLAPDVDLYVKTQPYTSGSIVNLDASPKLHINNTTGKGTIPMRPLNLTLSAPAPLVHAFETGNDVGVQWSYMSAAQPGTGAGMQGKGTATSISPVPGEFKLEFLTTGDVLKNTVTTTDTAYTYTNANMVTDFGVEPASFKIKLTVLRGGNASESKEITITRE